MEIIKMKMDDSKKYNGLFVRVTYDEALMLIQSLAAQMFQGNPNNERQEFVADDGTFFTVAAHKHLPVREGEK